MGRDWLLFGIIAAALIGVGGRLVYLEEARGASLRAKGDRQQTSYTPLVALRGDIFDAKGRVLARSTRWPSAFVDPARVDDPAAVARLIGPALGMPPAEVEQIITDRRTRRFAWVKRYLSGSDLYAFRRVTEQENLTAFGLRFEPRREYPSGPLAAHVLGLLGADNVGLAGIEQSFNEVLAGKDGKRVSTCDVLRQHMRVKPDEYEPPRDGLSVVLTIDAYLQNRTEIYLRQAVEESGAHWGAAILMDPHSGEVLAMAVSPTFDPADPFADCTTQKQHDERTENLRNRAIADAVEPGSIFKPFIASYALDHDVVTLDQVFAINGLTHAFGRRIIRDTHTYGSLPLWGVIAKSSNIGMGMVGDLVGNAGLFDAVTRFGFGTQTGINLPGEHEGIVHPFEQWTSYSKQSIPIGQELSATPIQLITAFSALCNGGLLYRPRIVRGVISADGECVEDTSLPIVVRRVISAETVEAFRRKALAEVVLDGTAKVAALPDWQVFGKTGTAQVARPDGRGYLDNEYCGSFIGGAPVESPQVVALVSLYRQQYYGSRFAAPAVREILRTALEYLQVPKSPPPAAGSQADDQDDE